MVAYFIKLLLVKIINLNTLKKEVIQHMEQQVYQIVFMMEQFLQELAGYGENVNMNVGNF